MSALELIGVSLVLGTGDAQVTAVDDLSLTVERGELLAVTGPSGSGKSSLLAVAGALIAPSGGQVLVRGTDIGTLGQRARTALRQRRIGFVFQTSNLLPSLTVREQLLVISHIGGGISRAARERADELLASVGMTHRAGHRPHELSGGERQRVGIARSLMGDPSLLLIDEPTSALDRQRAREIVGLLAEQVHSHSTAAVMVTHDTGVLDLADRVVGMRDGKLVAAEGDAANL